VGVLSSLGFFQTRRRQWNDAELLFLRAKSIDPYLPEVHNNLGLLMAEKFKFQEAIRCFERALTLRPQYREAQENLRVVQKRWSRRLEMSRKMRKRCLRLQKKGDWDGAFRILFDMMADSPGDKNVEMLVWGALAKGWGKAPVMTFKDHRLDPYFCHCDQCGGYWVSESAANAKLSSHPFAYEVVTNPVGIKCKSCGGIFCRSCYTTIVMSKLERVNALAAGASRTMFTDRGQVVCPKCGSKSVQPTMEPNGRYAGKNAPATASWSDSETGGKSMQPNRAREHSRKWWRFWK